MNRTTTAITRAEQAAADLPWAADDCDGRHGHQPEGLEPRQRGHHRSERHPPLAPAPAPA